MKLKIHGYIEGKKVKIRTKTGRKIERDGKKIDEVKIDVKYVGLGKVPPMSFRKERERYLRWLEADNDRWDAVALRGFNALKSLYAGGRNGIKPCPRAQQILFDGKLPQDTKLDVFKKIAEAKPEEQAKLIVQNKIPYSVAVGLVEQITPAVYAALVNNMTPQQVIDNMASMESRGAMDNPELKALIEKKLERAAKSENVAALKSKTAVATGRIKDEAIIKKMENVADQQIKKAGTIKQRTHLYIDKSGSMSLSIEVGKRLSAMISGATENEFHAIAFDKMAREVVADAKTMSAWERAFSGIKANDGTSIGCALDFAIRKGWDADQIIVVTDEGENNSPLFVSVLPAFEAKFGHRPRIVIVTVPDDRNQISHAFSTYLQNAKVEFEQYQPENGDYYGLPGLMMLVSKNSKLDLLYEIMDTPLMKRRPYPGKEKSKMVRKLSVEV